MEKFKRTIQRRMILMRAYSGVIAILILLGTFFNYPKTETRAISFIYGAGLGTMFLLFFYMRKYTFGLRNEETIKQLYIAENDERHRFILTKTGGTALNIVILGLALGSVIAGFFNEIIFFSLLGATIFSALVKGSLKWYYTKKV